jgi:hypothetical protein
MTLKINKPGIFSIVKGIVFFGFFLFFGMFTWVISHSCSKFEILLVGTGCLICLVQSGVELKLPWACLLSDKRIKGLTTKQWLLALALLLLGLIGLRFFGIFLDRGP